MADMVKDLWRDTNSSYKLDIELAQIRVIGQGPLNCAAPVSVAPQPAQQEKVEVIQKLTVQPAFQQQVQRTVKQVQKVQQVQQQCAQQQYVLQGCVTAEQLQQGYQSGLVQFNENGQAYTSNGYDLNAVNAGSVGQVYGGVATGYTSGGTATAAYDVGTSAYHGGATGSAARAGVANIGSTSIGAGLVSGSVDAAPLTEETLRLLESMQNENQTTVSTVGVDPLAGW
ncbi:hypothetical protein N9O95_04985 [Alphaproteobacteria bacterium]|nr:hypothetical protein [Alphaproteobacteria bacterium]